MIKALVFDFDGLILDTESSLISAYEAVHLEYGVAFDKDRFHRSVGHADYSFDPWSQFDPALSRSDLDKRRREKNKEIDLTLKIMPGVEDFLNEGKKQGLVMAVASNSRHNHVEGHLNRLGLISYFSFVACREDVKQPKPEPDLYRLVINNLGIRPFQAIAFEDSHTGSKAAKRAKLWVVAVPNQSTGHHDFSHTDKVVTSFKDISLNTLKEQFLVN